MVPQGVGFELVAFSNADHGGCQLDHKSTSGHVQFMGDKLVSWGSKKQHYVSTSTAEAEYVAAASYCSHVTPRKSELRKTFKRKWERPTSTNQYPDTRYFRTPRCHISHDTIRGPRTSEQPESRRHSRISTTSPINLYFQTPRYHQHGTINRGPRTSEQPKAGDIVAVYPLRAFRKLIAKGKLSNLAKLYLKRFKMGSGLGIVFVIRYAPLVPTVPNSEKKPNESEAGGGTAAVSRPNHRNHQITAATGNTTDGGSRR
ncbi:hypothetical protein OSB04_024436 [Centaurea solstitialis]|uniref:Uncharacterized protein n=1 Tax=Centaurea solstitialis TaxID=347529 RepID=A0AA38WC26_9ASTR|nr:hypothetical protein OSB04_024436 [Centaurea solstitialis]